jgi:hypothetical protein
MRFSWSSKLDEALHFSIEKSNFFNRSCVKEYMHLSAALAIEAKG